MKTKLITAITLIAAAAFNLHAGQVPDLPAVTSAHSDDLLYIINTHDTTDGASGSGRKIPVGALFSSPGLLSQMVSGSASFLLSTTNAGTVYNITTGTLALTGTLPNGTLVPNGYVIYVRKTDSGTGSITVNGVKLGTQGHMLQLLSDGTTWYNRVWAEGMDANGNMIFTPAGGTFTVNGNVVSPSGTFNGNGSALTNINGANVTGTVASATNAITSGSSMQSGSSIVSGSAASSGSAIASGTSTTSGSAAVSASSGTSAISGSAINAGTAFAWGGAVTGSGTTMMQSISPAPTGTMTINAADTRLSYSVIPRIAMATGTNTGLWWYDAIDLTGTKGAAVTSWPNRFQSGSFALGSGTGSITFAPAGNNGYPAALFTGSTARASLVSGSFLSGSYSGMTVFLQERMTGTISTATENFRVGYYIAGGSNGGIIGSVFVRPAFQNAGSGTAATATYNMYQPQLFTMGGSLVSIPAIHRIDPARPKVVCMQFDNSIGMTGLWINGERVAYDSMSGRSDLIAGGVSLGNIDFNGNNTWISGFLGFSRSLTNAEIQSVSNELMRSMRIATKPLVFNVGSSIQGGAGSSYGNSPTELLQKTFPGLYVQFVGHDGTGFGPSTLSGTWGDAIFDNIPDNSTVIYFGGQEDISSGGSTASIESSMTSIIANLHTRNVKVVLGTPIPGLNYSGTQQAVQDQYSAWVTGTSAADVTFDTHLSPLFASGTTSGTSGYFDSLAHPNDSGYQSIEPLIERALALATGHRLPEKTITGTLVSGTFGASDNYLINSKPWVSVVTGSNQGNYSISISGSAATVTSTSGSDASVIQLHY
jgi:hypothetical protein